MLNHRIRCIYFKSEANNAAVFHQFRLKHDLTLIDHNNFTVVVVTHTLGKSKFLHCRKKAVTRKLVSRGVGRVQRVVCAGKFISNLLIVEDGNPRLTSRWLRFMRKVFDVSGLEKNLNSSFYLGQETLRPCLPVAVLACVSLLLLRQTANVNLFHVAKFFIYLSFTVHYSYAKIGRFTPILSVRIVSSYFYLHITHFKNFST